MEEKQKKGKEDETTREEAAWHLLQKALMESTHVPSAYAVRTLIAEQVVCVADFVAPTAY